jgi:surfeit locus 1 family protein
VRSVLTPRWIAAHLTVIIIAVILVNLGLWQLRRLEERRTSNQVGESRFESDPLGFDELMSASGGDLDSLEYRRVTATGVFQREDEVLIRSQVYLDIAGFHVITPLAEEDGTTILVNRGWVPLDDDQVPVLDASPPEGVVTIEGWIHPTQERHALGPVDPADGRLVTMSRVDVERIDEQIPSDLAPVYIVMADENKDELPVAVDSPAFDDEGPHLGYAIQWFGFALIGLVGYGAMVRRAVRSG